MSDPLPPSLDEIWRSYGDQFRRRARTRLRQYGLSGQAESMDICNDVMTDLARQRPPFLLTSSEAEEVESDQSDSDVNVKPDQILAYIMRAIDHQVIDTFRSLARQCRDFRRNETVTSEDLNLATSEATPSQIAVRRETIDWIRSKLSPEDARMVDLMLSNHDWNEIGRIVGIKPDTARMRVRRAIDKAREEIAINHPSGYKSRDIL